MTARVTTCHDLTKNEADLKEIKALFLTLRTSATPTSLLLPWFPSPARKTGKGATNGLFTMLYTYVETRRHADPTSDPIDVLIAAGETTQSIVGVSLTPEVRVGFIRSDPTTPVVRVVLFVSIVNMSIVCKSQLLKWFAND